MTTPERGDVLAEIERAHDVVTRLCRPKGAEGSMEWIMSIPARPDRDPDLIIGRALSDAGKEIKALREALREIITKAENDMPYDVVDIARSLLPATEGED